LLVCILIALLAASRHGRPPSAAADYPHPVKWLIVSPRPAVPVDIFARRIAMASIVSEQFVVENRAGSGDTLGGLITRRPSATPAGSSPHRDLDLAVHAAAYNFIRAPRRSPASCSSTNILVVSHATPLKTVGVLDYCKANQQSSIRFVGQRHLGHCRRSCSAMTKCDMVHVPDSGRRSLSRHQLQYITADLQTTALGARTAKGGSVRALGVTSPTRWPACRMCPPSPRPCWL